MGGLTVLAALRAQLPNENFVYLGDTARLPYGTKTPQTVKRYAAKAAGQLVQRGVKALVIACNTASSVALEHLRAHFAPLPVIGVVVPGARAAMRVADNSGVLVLATESTIRGGAYQKELAHAGGRLPIYGRACPLWVTLAEQGPTEPSLTDAVLRHYLRGFYHHGPRTVLLGCTHFPVFRASLDRILATELDPGFTIVDSAQTTADVVARALSEKGLARQPIGADESDDRAGSSQYLATDGIDRFAQVGRYFLGDRIDDVELVDL